MQLLIVQVAAPKASQLLKLLRLNALKRVPKLRVAQQSDIHIKTLH